MFTGLVQSTGTVAAIQQQPSGIRLTIDRSQWKPAGGYQPAHGDSICVSGTCLTVVEPGEQTLSFDVIAETLAKTTTGDLKVGDEVNLEPSVTPNQPLGGHFMQGHVDGVGQVAHIVKTDEEVRLTIKPPAELMDYITPKGSVAIDGVSLTIAAVHDDSFELALIPTTLSLTTLKHRQVGDRVNIETDILSKTVVHYLQRTQNAAANKAVVNRQTLEEAGFA